MITTSLNNLPEEAVSHNPEIKKKVMLRYGDLPHLTNFSQARFAPGQTAPPHAHQDMCEVFFVEAGSGVIRIDGKEYPLLRGNCIAIELGEIHEIVNTGSTELVLTYFGLRVDKLD
ncbi:cupin domain-containing protein [Nostoc sp. PA-18-2419]|uniref:cupin domain-containing protein n=1 Tax=Nostoc sp. PA-18-2419 TaxID=2575443 RepID=UPI001108F955|nr:cupin domain-containing protein [Nostoc sp. PA-18-2419]